MPSQQKLIKFINRATLATYAGDGRRAKPSRPGFYDLEYSEDDFYYRDSFAGYLYSHGQEVIWFKDKPIWICSYTGGMQNDKANDPDFANQTFEFLKKSMRTNTGEGFHPRGPKEFKDGDWEYKNNYIGDISKFTGHEEIFYKSKLVFIHDYFGCILKDGRS